MKRAQEKSLSNKLKDKYERDSSKGFDYNWEEMLFPKMKQEDKEAIRNAAPATVILMDPGKDQQLNPFCCWLVYGEDVPRDALVVVCTDRYVEFECGKCRRGLWKLKPTENRLVAKKTEKGPVKSPLLLDYVNYVTKSAEFEDLIVLTNDNKLLEFVKEELSKRELHPYFGGLSLDQHNPELPSHIQQQFNNRTLLSLDKYLLCTPEDEPDYYHKSLEELTERSLGTVVERVATWVKTQRATGKSLPNNAKKLEAALSGRLCRVTYGVKGEVAIEALRKDGYVEVCGGCSALCYPKKDLPPSPSSKSGSILNQILFDMKKWISTQKGLPCKIEKLISHAANLNVPHFLPPFLIVQRLMEKQIVMEKEGFLEYQTD